MTVKEAREFLATAPDDATLCDRSGGDYIPIAGLQVRDAFHRNFDDYRASVDFPEDWGMAKVVRILRN